MGMFDEQELVGDEPQLALRDEVLLDGKRIGVAKIAEVADFKNPHRTPYALMVSP